MFDGTNASDLTHEPTMAVSCEREADCWWSDELENEYSILKNPFIRSRVGIIEYMENDPCAYWFDTTPEEDKQFLVEIDKFCKENNIIIEECE